jgi:hypothetical protein
MGKLEYTIKIKARLEKAFNFIADSHNSPEWHPSIHKAESVGEGPQLQLGSKLGVEAVVVGRRYVWEQEVVEFTPNK